MKNKPYKKAYVIECDICKFMTPVRNVTIADKLKNNFDSVEYRTVDEFGNFVWATIDAYYRGYDQTWNISENTLICPKCLETVQLAEKLKNLNSDDLEELKHNLNYLRGE